MIQNMPVKEETKTWSVLRSMQENYQLNKYGKRCITLQNVRKQTAGHEFGWRHLKASHYEDIRGLSFNTISTTWMSIALNSYSLHFKGLYVSNSLYVSMIQWPIWLYSISSGCKLVDQLYVYYINFKCKVKHFIPACASAEEKLYIKRKEVMFIRDFNVNMLESPDYPNSPNKDRPNECYSRGYENN